MLERRRVGTWGETHLQRFAVTYDFPVVFTRDAFDPDNPIFADALSRREPDKRHRMAMFFEWIEANADALAGFHPNVLDRLIERSARLHMRQIAEGGDPFETGSARPLDYGHWSAHRLETMTGHKVSHGEAVAIGVALDTRYAVLAGLLPPGEDTRICRLLERLGFRLW